MFWRKPPDPKPEVEKAREERDAAFDRLDQAIDKVDAAHDRIVADYQNAETQRLKRGKR